MQLKTTIRFDYEYKELRKLLLQGKLTKVQLREWLDHNQFAVEARAAQEVTGLIEKSSKSRFNNTDDAWKKEYRDIQILLAKDEK